MDILEFDPEHRPVSGDELRRAMGRFATGVTVVTTRDGAGAPVGTTVNAVTSLSLDPPLVLVCLARSSSTLAALRTHGAFALNVLGAQHDALSTAFARSANAAAWDGVGHRKGLAATPHLHDAIATVECALERLLDGGDHEIAIGRVIGAHAAAGEAEPLLFFEGGYGRMAPAAPVEALPGAEAVECALPTKRGGFRAVALSAEDGEPVVGLVHGDPAATPTPLVAAHAGCLLGEAFGSTLCDCRAVLDRSFDAIVAEGAGVVLHGRASTNPTGLCGADGTIDGAAAAAVLRRAGVSELRLWHHPSGLAAALRRHGLTVHHDLPRVA